MRSYTFSQSSRIESRIPCHYRVLHNIMNTRFFFVVVTCELSHSQTKAISGICDQLDMIRTLLLTFQKIYVIAL